MKYTKRARKREKKWMHSFVTIIFDFIKLLQFQYMQIREIPSVFLFFSLSMLLRLIFYAFLLRNSYFSH